VFNATKVAIISVRAKKKGEKSKKLQSFIFCL